MLEETYFVPVTILSEANKVDHWRTKDKRKKEQKNAIKLVMGRTKVKPPCIVSLTRIAPRALDAEDNLPSSLKWAKDCVADILVPGKQSGRADGDKRITWILAQKKGKVRQYGLEIHLMETG